MGGDGRDGAICNSVTQAGCGNAGSAHTGSQMAFLDWSITTNTIAQTLNTRAGQTYTIIYWVAGGHANSLSVTFGGTTLFSGTSPPNGVTFLLPITCRIPSPRRPHRR